MGLFAKRLKISGLIVIGKHMPLECFLIISRKKTTFERKKMKISPHSAYIALERMKLYLARPDPFLRSIIKIFTLQETIGAYLIKLHTMMTFSKEKKVCYFM